MSKYQYAKTAKAPATFISTYVHVLVDYIRGRNYGMAEEVANELLARVDETDWQEFNEWRKGRE